MSKRLYVGDWLLTEKTTEHLIRHLKEDGYTDDEIMIETFKGELVTINDKFELYPSTYLYRQLPKPAFVTESGAIYELVVDEEGVSAIKYDDTESD